MNRKELLAIGLSACLLAACGGGGGGAGGGPAASTNQAPSADAGPDQAVEEGAGIQLAGQGSDPEGSSITFQWSQVSGPAVSFGDPSAADTTVQIPEVPVRNADPIVLQLRVTDANGASGTDTVSIDVASTDFVAYIAGGTLFRYDPETDTSTQLSGSGFAAQFALSPDGRQVAYTADDDTPGMQEAYVVDVDSGTVVKINGTMQAGADVYLVRWSPDGSQIAYIADADQNDVGEVFLVNADGSSHRKISGGVGNPATVELTDAIWSPDGRYIAQTVRDRVSSRVLGVNTHDTQNPNSVRISAVPSTGTILRVAWSPDSSSVAYLLRPDTRNTIGQVLHYSRADGSAIAIVSQPLVPGGTVLDFEWAPDGSRIAYRADQDTDDVTELYSVFPDGSGRVKVAVMPADADVTFWAWAPDSSSIAYLADLDTDQVFELYSVRADGSLAARVNGSLVGGRSVGEFFWSPDSAWLAYGAQQDAPDVYELYVARADGSENLKVSGAPVSGGGLGRLHPFVSGRANFRRYPTFRWSPDSSRLAYRADQDTDEVYELYTVRFDASENFKVNEAIGTSGVNLIDFFSWSNDSSHLIYETARLGMDPFGLPTVSSIGLAGGAANGMHTATVSDVAAQSPSWSP